MRISALVKELKRIQALEDDSGGPIPDVYETTVETLIVRVGGKLKSTRLRLYP